MYIYINKRPWNGCSITVHEIVVLGCEVLYVDLNLWQFMKWELNEEEA